MLNVINICKSYNDREILRDISFSLSAKQKIALVGKNGSGKTTLLKILAGQETADSGVVEFPKYTYIGYLPQDTSLISDESIETYLKRISGIDVIEKEMETLIQDLTKGNNQELYGELFERYEKLGGYSFTNKIEIMLNGFGMDMPMSRSLNSLSSGQKTKVALIGILLKGVDLLLLDEPTNNLDISSLVWLEQYIDKSTASAIIVSHDRRFLDKVVNRVMELDSKNHTISSLEAGRYTDYLLRKEKAFNRQKEDYRLQQEEIKRLKERARKSKENSLQGSKYVGSDNDKFARGFKRDQASKSGKVAKAIEKRIEQMDKVDRPLEHEALQIQLSSTKGHSELTVQMSEAVIGYDSGFKIGPISLTVTKGQRIGILGLNGVGKSTLLKSMTKNLDSLSGRIEFGHGLIIGNLMQEHDLLPREETMFDFIRSKISLKKEEIYHALIKFGFDQTQIHLKISTLSPGGRARLLLALFSLLSVNVLVLDEPTNHLDVEAIEALKDVLCDYEGTVILVSHDRDFLEETHIDSFYLLENGGLQYISDLNAYIKDAELRANRLMKML